MPVLVGVEYRFYVQRGVGVGAIPYPLWTYTLPPPGSVTYPWTYTLQTLDLYPTVPPPFPLDRMTDRCLWTHYLPAATVGDCKYAMTIMMKSFRVPSLTIFFLSYFSPLVPTGSAKHGEILILGIWHFVKYWKGFAWNRWHWSFLESNHSLLKHTELFTQFTKRDFVMSTTRKKLIETTLFNHFCKCK